MLGGVDDDGNGVAYSYDAVGNMELVPYSSSGTGHELVQCLLDNQVGWKNMQSRTKIQNLDVQAAVSLVKDAFSGAGERDIYTGDAVDIFVVTEEGVEEVKFNLKND